MLRSWRNAVVRSASQLTQAQFQRVFRASSIQSNNYYSTDSLEERYKTKLLERARSLGFDSVESYKESIKKELEDKKRELNKIDPLKELEDYEQSRKMSSNIAKSRGPIDASQPEQPFKKLNDFLDVEKVKALSKQECEFLWRARWASKNNVLNAVVPIDIWKKIELLAKGNPIFVLPLPREVEKDAHDQSGSEGGMELHYVQWQFVGPNTVHCIMTTLAEFKLHKEFARPHTTLQFHLDLGNEKGIVFMNGQVEDDSNITLEEAQLLLLNIQRFYGAMGQETTNAKKRVQLLKDFTNGSPGFNVDALISLSQSME